MLRLAVIALLLANAGYYAWSQGHLRSWGLAPEEQSEPQRMQQQIRPETLQILRVNPGKPASSPSSSAAPAPAASAEAATAPPADALRTAAASLPQGSWLLEPTPIPGRWMVYMGRFDDLETLDRKRAELRARKVDHDRAGGTLEYGLSLGRFATKEAAERELATLSNKGVRTARVVPERPDATGFTLRLPAVTEALRPQLDALRSAMAGKTLRACG